MTAHTRIDKQTVLSALASMGAERLCEALGLCEGAPVRDKGEWWREGQGVMVRCPLHGGVSCHVFQGREGGIGWKCYGCDAKGDALALVAGVEGLDARAEFQQVLERAASIADVTPTTSSTPRAPQPPVQRPQRAPRSDTSDTSDIFARVADAILRDPATALVDDEGRGCGECGERDCALCYLDGRYILAGAINDGWRVIPRGEKAQRALVSRVVALVGTEAWTRSGLARAKDPSRIVWSDNRLIIPWRDRTGRVTALQRRVVGTPGENVPRYVQAGTARDPYGAHRLRSDVVLTAFVEGAVDALSLQAVFGRDGHRIDAVGLPGSGAWRESWAELARGRTAVVGLDDDTNSTAAEGVKRARASMTRDLAAVALRVENWKPHVDGESVKDWSDVWCRLRW